MSTWPCAVSPPRLHPVSGEPLTPELVKASYAEAIRTGDFTLRWLLDHLVADVPDLRKARDAAGDAAILRAAVWTRIGYRAVRGGMTYVR